MAKQILWFSPVPLPAVCEALGAKASYGGWWIWSLLRQFEDQREFNFAVAWASPACRQRQRLERDGVAYYIFPKPGRFVRGSGILRRLDDELGCLVPNGGDQRALAEAEALVKEWRPDLVHMFGSEHAYGLLASRIAPPTVVWIQGLLDVYQHHFFGSLGWWGRLRNPRLMWNWRRMSVGARREQAIFSGCRHFIGRTAWDAAHQVRLQPKGRYYPVQDCLRPEFYRGPAWSRGEVKECTVYTTTSAALLKGTDILLQAVGLLQRRWPEIRLRIGGDLEVRSPVARRLRQLVTELDLASQVDFLGQLDANQIVRELRQARAFVLPSFIENNPNSLAEAQLVGTPAVAAYIGGVPDMVKEGETGLLFQSGDSAMLACQISRLLADDALAARLSHQSRRVAHQRHDPRGIADALKTAYTEILATTVKDGP